MREIETSSPDADIYLGILLTSRRNTKGAIAGGRLQGETLGETGIGERILPGPLPPWSIGHPSVTASNPTADPEDAGHR